MGHWPPITKWLHLDWVLLLMLGWLLVGIVGVLALRRLALVARVFFPAGGLLGPGAAFADLRRFAGFGRGCKGYRRRVQGFHPIGGRGPRYRELALRTCRRRLRT